MLCNLQDYLYHCICGCAFCIHITCNKVHCIFSFKILRYCPTKTNWGRYILSYCQPMSMHQKNLSVTYPSRFKKVLGDILSQLYFCCSSHIDPPYYTVYCPNSPTPPSGLPSPLADNTDKCSCRDNFVILEWKLAK
jgi:hypothetical protein